MKTRQITVLAILALLSVFAVAGVVTYLSNTVWGEVTVSSPTETTETATVNGIEVPITAIPVYGGETVVLNTNVKNLSSVPQVCDLTITTTPSVTLSNGEELTTEIIKTVELEAYAEEANEYTITPANNYVGTFATEVVCNVVD